jgi:hypothetical protein
VLKKYSFSVTWALALAITLLCPPKPSQAGLFDGPENQALQAIQPDIDYLVGQAGAGATSIDPARVKGLLQFVSTQHKNLESIKPTDLGKAPGAFWQFPVKASLSRIGSYFFNPDTPPQALLPGSVRLGGWRQAEAVRQQLGSFWKTLPGVKTPMVVKGVEFEECTPDSSSGAYYAYEVKRYLAVFNEGGRDVAISVSRLKSPSAVGKKGTLVGSQSDWNFFYSGLKGNLLKAVGWADSYIYDSCSIYVMLEPEPGKPMTSVSLFKWVNAGWSNINMVKRENILAGCKSMASMFKEMIESPLLPSVEEITKYAAQVAKLGESELRARVKPLAQLMEKLAPSNENLSRDEFAPLLKDAAYVNALNKEEMQSELVKDFVRKAVRRKSFTAADGAQTGK